MRFKTMTAILLALALVAAACGDDDAADGDGGDTGSCEVTDLNLVTPDTLTVATGEPAFPPWVSGPDGANFDDPESGTGFEAALVYALAAEMGFTDDQVTWITDLTADRDRFLRRLGVQEAYGQTALYDALAATPKLVDKEIKGRKAIVLITDGHDNASKLNNFKSMQLARSVQVPIYTIAFSRMADRLLPEGSVSRGMSILGRFSRETGGRLFSVADPDDLKDAVLEIQEELRFQYVIGYHSLRETWDGAFRRIKLELDRKGLEIRTRRGYYANP